jgi:site-specific DNA recombinase
VVVCHAIERFSREPLHLVILVDEMTRLGITVEFVTEPLDNSPEAELIRYVKGYAGKIENVRRRERQMRATRERARRGQPVSTGRAPLGYSWCDAS